MAEKLLDRYNNGLREVALVPSQGGAFEVSVDGDKIYSKIKTGRFPSAGALLKEVGTRL